MLDRSGNVSRGRAVVTGASGFIGRNLVEELVQNGYEVFAVVHTEASAQSMKAIDNGSLEVVLCDLPDFSSLCKVVSGRIDYFFHLAWEGVAGPKSQDFLVQEKNIRSAVEAVRTAHLIGCSRFIGAGSIQETECLREMEGCTKTGVSPSFYKTAKLAAHYFCQAEAKRRGIDFFWPRLTNAYGVGEISPRLVNSVIRQLQAGVVPALTKGDQLYNFIYVTDAARAYRLIAERGRTTESYVVGSEEVAPLENYLVRIRHAVNPDIELGFGKRPFEGVHLRKEDLFTESLFLDTGFASRVSFDEGIRLTAEYLLDAGDAGSIQM